MKENQSYGNHLNANVGYSTIYPDFSQPEAFYNHNNAAKLKPLMYVK